jgi:glycosyltransferase involved in cell wall biosynthesis
MDIKPRLLFLSEEDLYFYKHRLDLAKAAREDGFEVLVAAPVQHHRKAIEDEGFRLFPIQLRRGLQSPIHDLGLLAQLILLYRRERPDIVHHIGLKQVLLGAISGRIARVPVMVNAITGLGFLFSSDSTRASMLRIAIKPLLRWALAHPHSAVIFENEEDRIDMVSAGIVAASRTVVINGAGVNVTLYCSSPEPEGIPVVLLPSRMLWDKGVGVFIEAVRILKQNGPPARYVLVGGIDRESPTAISEDQIQAWVREGIVEWWGYRDNMPEVYAASHIVTLPSYYGEGLPVALLEAAASGKPLITTRMRGCRDVVRDGDNGILVPVKDALPLAKAIVTLLESPELRQRMGKRGREIVLAEFSSKFVADKVLALYHQSIGKEKPPVLVDLDDSARQSRIYSGS